MFYSLVDFRKSNLILAPLVIMLHQYKILSERMVKMNLKIKVSPQTWANKNKVHIRVEGDSFSILQKREKWLVVQYNNSKITTRTVVVIHLTWDMVAFMVSFWCSAYGCSKMSDDLGTVYEHSTTPFMFYNKKKYFTSQDIGLTSSWNALTQE